MRCSRIRLLLVAGAVAFACTGSSKAPPPEPAPSAPTARSLIDLRPLTITFGGHPIVRLQADGRTESVGNNAPASGVFVPGPTLRGDGTIVLTKAGFTARLEKTGDIYVVSPPGTKPPEQLQGRISGNRWSVSISGAPRGVRIDDATIVFDQPGAPDVIGKIEGTVDANTRHTALVMTAAFFIDMAITAR